MTILAVIGEFDCGGNVNYYTTSSLKYDTNYSRMGLDGHSSFSDTTGHSISVDSSSSTIWIHCRFDLATSSIYDGALILIKSGSDEILRIDESNGDLTLQYHNGTAWTNIGYTYNQPGGVLNIDIEVYVHDTLGRFAWYVGENTISSLDGDTKYRTGTTIDELVIPMGGSTGSYLSEVIVADECTFGWRLATLVPNADHTITDFSGTYADIDDIIDDATYQSSSTATDQQMYDMTSLYDDGFDIQGVVICYRARDNGSTPDYIRAMIRPSSSDVDIAYSSSHTLTTSFVDYRHIWTDNPKTSSQWTRSEIGTLLSGFECRSS